ncbi:hypothetical protein LWI28_010107 [Acer negundo]|uniref:Uncharacterized protein n=1 Tax=Acer negundo TaxID=4023 RepID=A0AAD5JD05_ACENE|nr:hypothetical protein LWI28_010107 [Acer negundo]
MQSLLSSPTSRASVTNRSCLGRSQLFPVNVQYGPTLRRYGGVSVRCSAEDNDVQKEQPTTIPPPQPQRTTPIAPKVSTKFSDVLAFGKQRSGCVCPDIQRWDSVVSGTSVVLSLASLIPLFKGVSVESKSKGLMTSDAELLNGRLAMLGLVALAFTEYVKGGTLV